MPASPDVDVAIIGAGAAGLATAIFAKRRSPALRVRVLDGARSPGAKILVSGGGRCNVTNVSVTSADFNGDLVILTREIDPATMKVKLTCIGETAAKHDYALGKTGVPPPTPALGQTAEERDTIADAANSPPRAAHEIVGFDPPVWPMDSDDTSITVYAFVGVLDNGESVIFPTDTITGLANGTRWGVFYDLTAETYSAIEEPATAERADSGLAFVGWQKTSTAGSFPTPTPPPGGAGGGGGYSDYAF